MEPECRIGVMSERTWPRLKNSASVGKRSNGIDLRISACGYKRRFDASRTPSASPSAPDIRPPTSPMLPCHRPDDITQSLSNVCILDLVVRTDQLQRLALVHGVEIALGSR